MKRLLVRSGTSYTVPAPTYATLVTVANAGALLGQNYPNAVYYNGVTYFGYNNGDNGNIEVRTYTHATGVTSAAKVVEAGLEVETHDPPSLLMRASDHKLMVFFFKHSAGDGYLRIATTAESITAFGARVALDPFIGATDYTYPTAHQLTGLANQPIYLFFRDGNTSAPAGTKAWLTYSVSTDDGATWSAKSYVHKPADKRPYWMVRSNNVDRIDVFIEQDERQAVDNTPAAHCYFDGTTWRGTDGTALSGSAPFAYSAFTQVNDGALGSVDPQDINYLPDGRPIVGWRMWLPPVANRVIDSYYARWTGSAWVTTKVQADSDEIVLLTPTASMLTAYTRRLVGGVYHIWRYRSTDEGASWSGAPVYTATTGDLEYLSGIRDQAAGLEAIWAEGTYTSATSFDFGIRGVTG